MNYNQEWTKCLERFWVWVFVTSTECTILRLNEQQLDSQVFHLFKWREKWEREKESRENVVWGQEHSHRQPNYTCCKWENHSSVSTINNWLILILSTNFIDFILACVFRFQVLLFRLSQTNLTPLFYCNCLYSNSPYCLYADPWDFPPILT